MTDEKLKKRKQIGANLRIMRFAANLHQSTAAKMVGITQPHLSMIENGTRRASVELYQKLIEIYSSRIPKEDIKASGENDASNIVVDAVKLLQWLVKKTDSEELKLAADNYICLCTYVFLRKLYLANPHNTGKVFSIPHGTFEQLADSLCDEPDKVVSFAKASKSVPCSKLEPDESEISEFLCKLLECENFIAPQDKSGKA